jgi:hypothetical protein
LITDRSFPPLKAASFELVWHCVLIVIVMEPRDIHTPAGMTLQQQVHRAGVLAQALTVQLPNRIMN